MACCLTAPSHYLNLCWLIISEVLCHTPKSNFTHAYDLNHDVFGDYIFKMTTTSPRGQWVKVLIMLCSQQGVQQGQDHCLVMLFFLGLYQTSCPIQNIEYSCIYILYFCAVIWSAQIIEYIGARWLYLFVHSLHCLIIMVMLTYLKVSKVNF